MSEIQSGCPSHPERCVLGHPFNPPHLMPLVEIVGGAKTSEETIQRVGGDKAFYAPAHDYIQLPRPESYFEPINWHRTALHELGHWTGHASRLARDLSGAIRIETLLARGARARK